MDRRTTLNFLIGLLLAGSMLGTMPFAGAQSEAVTPRHVADIRAEPGQDPEAPFGTWTKLVDSTTFYLHRDAPNNPAAPAQGEAPGAPVNEAYYLDYEKPKNDINDVRSSGTATSSTVEDLSDPDAKKVQAINAPAQNVPNVGTVGGRLAGAYFIVPLNLTPTLDLRVYQFEIEVYATCSSGGDDSAPGNSAGVALRTTLERVTKNSAGQWVRNDISGNAGLQSYGGEWVVTSGAAPTASTGANRFTATLTVNNQNGNPSNPQLDDGKLWKGASAEGPEERFQIGFVPDTAGTCTIHFDSVEMPSLVRIVADSSRVNTWIENKDGEPTLGLPTPSRTAPADRRFMVQTSHVSAWPRLNSYFNARTDVNNPCVAVTGAPPQAPACRNVNVPDDNLPVDYQDDFWDRTDNSGNPGPGGVIQDSFIGIRLRDMQSLAFVQGTDPANILQIGRTVVAAGDAVNRVEILYQYPGTLAERPYRAEIFSDLSGVAVSEPVTIGLKGFTMESLDFLAHSVNPKEATEFRFRVRNTGGEDDTVTVVAVPPGNSWGAEVIGASSHFLKANGGEAEVVLRVTPPDTAVAGASQAIAVTASSANFPNDVQPITRVVTVNVVSGLTRAIDVTSRENVVVLAPGTDTSLAGVRVRNNGTQLEQVTLQPIVPSTAVGWTFQATPLSKEILAASSSDFAVRIRAPVDAPAGQTFSLGLLAQRLGDAGVQDRVNITITVQVRHSFSLTPLQSDIPVRDFEFCSPDVDGGLLLCGPVRDTDSDQSAVFRIYLNNTGPVPDTYRFRGKWVESGSVGGKGIYDLEGSSNCDGSEDKPEYWQYEFGNASQIDGTPSKGGTNQAATLRSFTVPAFSTQLVYLELGHILALGSLFGDSDFACDKGSPAAAFTLTAVSSNDPGNSRVLRLGAYRTDTGAYVSNNRYSGGVHNVRIEPDVHDADARAVTQPSLMAQHVLRVTNTGNEKDSLIVQVPAGTGGWTRALQQVSPGSVPNGVTCSSLNAGKTRWLCPMGARDEVLFRLNVTPGSSIPVGSTDRAIVTVISGDEGSVNEFYEFVTATVGTFQFDAQSLSNVQKVERGKTALVPFVLHNLGSSGDRLNLSVIAGDSSWAPRLGLPQSNFVPAGKSLNGFLSVTVPSAATQSKLFRIQVTSQGNSAIDTMDFTLEPISAGTLKLAGTPSNVTTIAQTNVARYVNVTVTEPGGSAGRVVTVAVAPGSLPAGWTVSPASRDVTLAAATGGAAGLASFNVTAPTGALGNSRVPLLLRATSVTPNAASGQADLLLQLADVFGVKLSPADNRTAQTIVPGGQVRYNLTVENLGTSTDTIRFSTTAPPAGWLIQTDPAELALGPLENRSLSLLVRAPSTAAPRNQAVTTLQAASLGSGAVSAVTVKTTVGFYELLLGMPNATATTLAPTETGSFVIQVKNNGTIADEVAITPRLANPSAHGTQVTLRAVPDVVQLGPNQTKEVRIDVVMGAAPPSASAIAFTTGIGSRLAPATAPANATGTFTVNVVRYVAIDADGDGIPEYAIDRDANTANGYESYLDTGVGGGKQSSLAPLETFLSPAAREDRTIQVPGANNTTVDLVQVVVDGDADGLRDLFIDSNGDGLPDHYWDPDGAKRQDLGVVKDVDADAAPDYFVDTDATAGFDKVYSLREGTFTRLLSIDVDGDGTKDYIVDKDGDGRLDEDETVLYARDNRLITVQKVDMDGDGELDDVFDTDGDGTPDSFIPAGEEGAIEIVLKDVNGDGTADWAYDADGDGRLDSYYDPVAKESRLIDSRSDFVDALKEYWFIGALFGVVLVLFVVLLLVTRR